MRAYLCKYPGCTHIVDTPRTYCKQHAALGQAAEMRKADAPMPQWAGAERPNGALYNTTLWRKLRREVLREIGQCVICGATDRLHVHHITPPTEIRFALPKSHYVEWKSVANSLKCWAAVTITKPFRPRSTGPLSQNHHLNGHIQEICMETGNDFDAVKTWVKQQAIARGYPFETSRGVAVPKSEAYASVEECAILIDVVHQLAAELGIMLTENEEY